MRTREPLYIGDASGKAGAIAAQLSRLDLVVLDDW